MPPQNAYFRITSINDVPTASGLASSSSGLAALAYGLIQLYQLERLFSMSQLSAIARVGSGSACRSLFGGFVLWRDEEAAPLENNSPMINWTADISAIVLIQPQITEKIVPSSLGMQTTVSSSSLFEKRPSLAEKRLELMVDLLSSPPTPSSYSDFCELIMKDSNSFHALCIDTFPPLFYLNQTSHRVIYFVHFLNANLSKYSLSAPLAYTFDAGPHPVLICKKCDQKIIISILNAICSVLVLSEDEKSFKSSHKFNLSDFSDFLALEGLSSEKFHCVPCSISQRGPFII